MRLKLTVPEHWPCTKLDPKLKKDAKVVYEPLPGVTLTIGPLRPTPADLRSWGDSVVLAGVDPSMYRVRNVDDLETARGWPVTIFFSDIVSILPESPGPSESSLHAPLFLGEQGGRLAPRAAPAVLERRLHALYMFDEYCGVAIARSTVPARFESLLPDLRRVVLTGEPDWRSDTILALADLWRGLDCIREEPRPSAPGTESATQEADQVK